GILVANCEIYNWRELAEKYKLEAMNDAHLLFLLFEQGVAIQEILKELDGVYAFAYVTDKAILARDIMGVKPLWFSAENGFCFASEKKVLENAQELNPRQILVYDLRTSKIETVQREFYSLLPEVKENKAAIRVRVTELLEAAVRKRIPEQKFGLLFSGGVDSAVLAVVLKKLGCKFRCYTVAVDSKSLAGPEDLEYARIAAEDLGLDLSVVKISEDKIYSYLQRVVPLIEDSVVAKVGVALTFFAACEQAKKDGCKVIFSGTGSEDIFGGYRRHRRSTEINKECLSGLRRMYERDTYRDDVITMFNGLELRVPFLDKALIEYCLRIPGKYKVGNGKDKVIFREIAEGLGLPKEIAWRKKLAAQYGSKVHKAIRKAAHKNGCHLMSSYLRQFYAKPNLRLGALVSSGKDSLYAMFVLQRQNYEIGCLISVKSENPDSYMFHTPGVELVRLQAEAMGLPLVEQSTKGEKEAELEDLRRALIVAKEKYKIQGVVSGALFSVYQRDRIEKLCDELGLKCFAPLWHMQQDVEVRDIIKQGFKVVMTKVAAEGLDRIWLNKVMDYEMLDKLIALNKKIGFNVAGEGGEYESLVLDAPMFAKKIDIADYDIIGEGCCGELVVKKARLVGK
ncbi:MAG: diphthine--ammonia ligase, partial [Candidatus Woesearchaeota archaeon]